MYTDYDMMGTPVGAMRAEHGEIVVYTDRGRRMDRSDLNAKDLVQLGIDLQGVDISGDDWYAALSSLKDVDGKAGAGGEGGGNDGEAGETGEGQPAGTGEGEGEGEGEGAGTDDGTGDDGTDGADGTDEQGADGTDDKKEEDMPNEFDSPDMGEQSKAEQEDLADDKLLQEIWDKFEPFIAARDDIHSTSLADYAHHVASRHGGGGTGGQIIKVSGAKVGAVDGLTHELFEKVLSAVARQVNVYLPGDPGTGKSHMVEQIAEALSVAFGVTSFSPMSTESKLLGFNNAHGVYVPTVFRERYEFGGVMLLDELDNANPAIVAVLNGGLANNQMEFPDGIVKRHKDFVAIATANTLGTGPTAEFAGRQRLDPATLNRFVKIPIHTDEVMEDKIVNGMIGVKVGQAWLKKIRHVRRACVDLRIKHFVTMRDSINGARLIAPGDGAFTQLEALEHTCLGSLSEDQVSKIKAWKG